MTIKKWLCIPFMMTALFSSLFASSEEAVNSMSKVTVVVFGMMKSKSGAT